MQNELLIAVLAGLGGMLGWGLADFFAKKTFEEVGDVATLAWGHIFGTVVLFAMYIYQVVVRGQEASLSFDLQTWLLLLVFGMAQATVYLYVYRGFAKGQIAVLNPIFASFSGLTALLSIIVFREHVTGYTLAGLVVLFAGIILISADFKALRARKLSFAHIPGFNEVVMATLMAALWTLFWDKVVGGQDWLVYTLLMYTFMTITILAVARLQGTKMAVRKPSVWKFLFLVGLCEIIAYLAISIGYSQTSMTSIVALLSGAFSLPVIVLARIFLKEKITRLQTIGSFVIVAGIMLLAAYN